MHHCCGFGVELNREAIGLRVILQPPNECPQQFSFCHQVLFFVGFLKTLPDGQDLRRRQLRGNLLGFFLHIAQAGLGSDGRITIPAEAAWIVHQEQGDALISAGALDAAPEGLPVLIVFKSRDALIGVPVGD